ncbi:MAG: glycosyltransferase [Ruminococcaceae bacterium]|nr:glycosyltransferase [Oscillospiraceae bacterium]
MNILYLLNYAGKGGTEKYVRDLVSEYNGSKANCYFAYNEDGLLREQLEDMGVSCFRLPMKNVLDLRAARLLAKYCKENGIDIIHTQFPRENVIAVLSKLFNKKIKVFNTNHLIMTQGAFWKIINKIISPFNEKVFAVCNCGKDVLISNGVKKEKIEVVFNGIKIAEKNTSTLRNELGIADNTYVISTLTRYSAEKGLHFLVDTVDEMKKRNIEDFAFVVAGDGPLYDEISDKIDSLGLRDNIYQLGYRTDTQNILCASDLFVNLSSTEALSFAIIEALSFGIPVVATNVGGTVDIINDKTACGVLVEYGDVKSCADEIVKYMCDKDKYETSSQNAFACVKEHFDIQNVFNKVYDCYEKAIK